jgi:hypothetical protein
VSAIGKNAVISRRTKGG